MNTVAHPTTMESHPQPLYSTGEDAMFVTMAAYMVYRPHEHAHGAHEDSGHEHTSLAQAETTMPSPHKAHQHEATEHAAHA